MNKDLYNSTVTEGICKMRSSDQMHINNIAFEPAVVSKYATHLEEEMDKVLFESKDDTDLVQLIQMHEVTLLSLVKMN